MVNYGLVIGCRDLQVVKNFYINFLELESPIIDRVDWVEFSLPNSNATLALQKVETENSNNHLLIFYTQNYKKLIKKLNENKYSIEYERQLLITEKHQFFNDNEGNAFVLIDKTI